MKNKKPALPKIYVLYSEESNVYGYFTSWQKARAFKIHRELLDAWWCLLKINPDKHTLGEIIIKTMHKRSGEIKDAVMANNPLLKALKKYEVVTTISEGKVLRERIDRKKLGKLIKRK